MKISINPSPTRMSLVQGLNGAMTRYFFDASALRWWVLHDKTQEWEQIENAKAYQMGLFDAVTQQQCTFLNVDIDEYKLATKALLERLESQCKPNGSVTNASIPISQQSPSQSQHLPKSTPVQDACKTPQEYSGQLKLNSKELSKLESGNIDERLDLLKISIKSCNTAPVSSPKPMCDKFVRNTLRHATMRVTSTSLSDSIKQVAQERDRILVKQPPGPHDTRNLQKPLEDSRLMEMIQRARTLARSSQDSNLKDANNGTRSTNGDKAQDRIDAEELANRFKNLHAENRVVFEESSDDELVGTKAIESRKSPQAPKESETGIGRLLTQRLSIRKNTIALDSPEEFAHPNWA
ncbi:hypothetical protein BdWA1_000972 [Babesia duncani]|uniref:Uncharacterized protein n=1 Tax=Babesia duncani TaxID=323732 RepID=A0AAD9PP64_9APIC|nr:hypothetical protein BdWA1_000972 [Babesia duncani]